MVKTSISYSPDQARDKAILEADDTVVFGADVRIIPFEDSGHTVGPIKIGPNTKIREGSVICSGVTIGHNSIVGYNNVVRSGVVIGNHTVFSHHVCVEIASRIGSRVRISALTHITGGCVIEDEVQIGARVVTINDREMMWGKQPKLLAPVFRKGCRVGSGVTVMSGVEIGINSLIGAGAVVTRDIPPNVIAYGVPAYVQREIGENS